MYVISITIKLMFVKSYYNSSSSNLHKYIYNLRIISFSFVNWLAISLLPPKKQKKECPRIKPCVGLVQIKINLARKTHTSSILN